VGLGATRSSEGWQDRVARLRARSDVRLSIALHAVIGGDPTIADTVAKLTGLRTSSFNLAARMLETPTAILEQEQRELAIIVNGVMSPVVEAEEVTAVRRIRDLTHAEALERVWRAGWMSGVLNRPNDGGGHPADSEARAVWRDGRAAFAAELAAFNKSRAAEAAA